MAKAACAAMSVIFLMLVGCGGSVASGGGDNPEAGPRICHGAPGEIPGQNCVPPQPDGGIYGRCLGEGEEFDAKIIGATCCEGLSPIFLDQETSAVYPGYPAGCGPGPAPPSVKVCARCGDGVCGVAENRCNCAADCR